MTEHRAAPFRRSKLTHYRRAFEIARRAAIGQSRRMGPALAFFDLDKTLFSSNSATLWIRHERRAGRIDNATMLRALYWVVRYSLGSVALDEPIRRSVSSMRGQPEAEMLPRVAAFYEDVMRGRYRAGGLRALDNHRAAGHRLVLLTSSSNYVSQLVRDELGLDEILCNRFEVDGEGLYTGALIEPLVFAGGKVEAGRACAARHEADLAQAYFYTDSHSDLPMLEAVGNPVVVHPDPRLRREARRRSWPIEMW